MTRRQEHRPVTLRMTRTIDSEIPFTPPMESSPGSSGLWGSDVRPRCPHAPKQPGHGVL
jgi:hypothetical protein